MTEPRLDQNTIERTVTLADADILESCLCFAEGAAMTSVYTKLSLVRNIRSLEHGLSDHLKEYTKEQAKKMLLFSETMNTINGHEVAKLKQAWGIQ